MAEGECTALAMLLNDSGDEKSLGVGVSPVEQPAKITIKVK
jgi:hypothetical protein